jgi:hypothetical protein
MRQFGAMVFPVSAVKRFDRQFPGLRLQTSDIDIEAVRIGSRDIESFNAARLTKPVLRHAGIERIRRKVVFAVQQRESGTWHNQMEITRFGADRTVALDTRDSLRRFDPESNRSAMTTAVVKHQSTS